MRVSLVIPHYNDARWLPGTLASVVEHEKVAVLVVDDASTDADVETALAAAERGPGVRVLLQPLNSGPSAAMTRGAREAQTEYVFFLGSDDELVPGALGRLADALDADPALTFAYGDFELFGAEQRIQRSYEWAPWRAWYGMHWPGCFMIRRQAFLDLGGLPTRSAFEDWDFFMTLAETGSRGVRVPGISFRYRITDDARRFASNRGRMLEETRLLRAAHPRLRERLPQLRREAHVSPLVRVAYPAVFGLRARMPQRAGDALFGALARARRLLQPLERA